MNARGRLGFYKRLIAMSRYLFDKRVPFIKKMPIIAWLIYLASPVDFLPDPVLGLGIVDDAVLLGFLMTYIGKRLDEYYVKREERDDRIIEDVEYEVGEEDKDSG